MTDYEHPYLGMQELNILLALAVLFVAIAFLLPLVGMDLEVMSQSFRASGMGAFFASQGPNILTLVVMFLTVIVLFKMLGVDFDPEVDKHVAKVVTVESMSPMGVAPIGMCAKSEVQRLNYPTDEEGNVMYDDVSYYEGKLSKKSNMAEN